MTDTAPILARYNAAADARSEAANALDKAAADYWKSTNAMLDAELELRRIVDGDKEAANYMMRYVNTNRSNWSGGYTAHNMTEQITRELALAMLERVLRVLR